MTVSKTRSTPLGACNGTAKAPRLHELQTTAHFTSFAVVESKIINIPSALYYGPGGQNGELGAFLHFFSDSKVLHKPPVEANFFSPHDSLSLVATAKCIFLQCSLQQQCQKFTTGSCSLQLSKTS